MPKPDATAEESGALLGEPGAFEEATDEGHSSVTGEGEVAPEDQPGLNADVPARAGAAPGDPVIPVGEGIPGGSPPERDMAIRQAEDAINHEAEFRAQEFRTLLTRALVAGGGVDFVVHDADGNEVDIDELEAQAAADREAEVDTRAKAAEGPGPRERHHARAAEVNENTLSAAGPDDDLGGIDPDTGQPVPGKGNG